MFNGLDMNPNTLPLLSNAESRSLSAENPNGEKGRGGMAVPGENSAARDLGVGWKVAPSKSIAPGETYVVADIDGPGAIQSIWMAAYVGRDFIIRIYWDGQENPSVECPQPDFFACGWDNNGNNPFTKHTQLTSQMVCVNPNRALNCFWCMPFKKHCLMTVENRGRAAHTLFYQVNYTLTEVPDDVGYFHAQFRHVDPLPFKEDFVILDGVKGWGQYVGTSLCAGLNGNGGWWGEGEIKFFIDGDGEFPTICGTGTEDYFLGAYSWLEQGHYLPYTTPYAGTYKITAPDGLFDSQQRFSMYRWHVVDPVRFKNDLRVTIQDLGFYSDGTFKPRQDTFASVAYWYQTLPTAPTFPPLPSVRELDI